MTQKNWKIKPVAESQKIAHLCEVLSIDEILANLLVQRKIETYEQAKAFFRPNLENLYDPFLMKDMEKAVERLENALQKNEKILIYGDYDVDGTTAVSMVYSFLKKRNQNIDYYIPNRYDEGYGISFRSIDFAFEKGFSLIIALDCGIKAVEKIEYAKTKNIDFIICDHHNAGEILPNATAVLDPKRIDCYYPFKELSGCGVGFKLLQAFCVKNNIPIVELYNYLDLVCVSIASDIVPIIDENRILAFYGLRLLNTGNARLGLKSIIKVAGIENKNIDIFDCVFKIGPRINAAGRIDLGQKSVDLLTAENETLATEIARKVDSFNTKRKNLDKEITKEALKILEFHPELQKQKSTVLYNPNWHKGVIGIVASRIIESHYRPTVILSQSNGKITGSARSVVGFNLYEAIESCSDLLENFGGHFYAAGLTLKPENLEKFKQRFENFVAKNITPEQEIPQIDIDAEIPNFSMITPKFYRILKQFEPFGPENMTPVFLSENIRNNGNCRIIGNTREHLKLDMLDNQANHINGVAFQLAKYFPIISKSNFDICYTVVENEFLEKINIELEVRDIRKTQIL